MSTLDVYSVCNSDFSAFPLGMGNGEITQFPSKLH